MKRNPLAGESHPGAVLTDHECGLVIELRAAGLSLNAIALKFEVHKQTVAKICSGQRRSYMRDNPDPVPRRRCTAPLPALPARAPGSTPAERVMQLIVLQLSTC